MKFWLRAATIAAAIAATASTASFAQYETNNRSHFGLRLSTFKPSSSQLSGISSAWYGPTIDYNIRFDENDRPTLVASLTMLGQDKNGRKCKLTPLTLSYLKHFAKDKTANGWYAGAGLGYYTFNYEATGYYSEKFNSKDKTFGFSLLGGYEFADAYFMELKYDKIGSVKNPVDGDISFDGLTFSIGTRVAY